MASPTFQRFAALAETLTILVLGNVAGLGIYQVIVPTTIDAGTASPAMVAFWSGALILLRLGAACLFGFSLLYYRRGITPRYAGLTRNNYPLVELLRAGLLLGVVTTLPISFLFSAHALIPFGEGLSTWWAYDDREINAAFWISVLGTSVLIPPLIEEIFTRGYQRIRLVESYGTMGGVVLTALVFAFSHTRYLAPDYLLLLFLATIVFSSICWTYFTQKTGSVIPAIVAHAVTNGTATLILFEVWVPLISLLTIALIFRRPILETIREFFSDWKDDMNRNSVWIGIVALMVVFTVGLALLPFLGRLQTLTSIGVVLLVFTVANLIHERRVTTE